MSKTEEVEQLKENEDIKTALKQTSGTKESTSKPVVNTQDKFWFGTYIPSLRRLLIGAILIVLIAMITKSIRVYLISQIENKPARYNLTRVLNLLMVLAIGIIGLSLIFASWYTAVVALGLISLILGFALQTPITSLIGWIYLLIRQPYRVGDRSKLRRQKAM